MAEITWAAYPVGELEKHAALWNGFVTSSAYPAFMRTEFLIPAIEVFGCDNGRLMFGRDGTKLVAVAVIQRTGFGRWAVFQPSQLPLGAAAIAPGHRWDEVLPSLLRTLPFALSLSVTQQDPKLAPRPEAAQGVEVSDYGATGWIDVTGPFSVFWEARGKNLRQNARKQRRKIEEQGSRLTFEFLEESQAVQAAFLDFAQLESLGWKASQGTAIGVDNAQGRFYRDMLARFGSRGAAFAMRLSLDGRPIAVDFGIREGATLVVLKTTYDENLKGISPGQLLHEDGFGAIFERYNPGCIEFYGKMMEWHTRWTDTSRMLFHLTCDRLPLLRRIRGRLKRPAPPAPVRAA